MPHDFSRPDFVKSSAAAFLQAQNSNSKLTIGGIGTGAEATV